MSLACSVVFPSQYEFEMQFVCRISIIFQLEKSLCVLQDLIDDMSISTEVGAWWYTSPSHYPHLCWPRHMTQDGVIKLKAVQYRLPTRNASYIQIPWNLVCPCRIAQLPNRFQNLYRGQQRHCRALCKNSKLLDHWNEYYGSTKFRMIRV